MEMSIKCKHLVELVQESLPHLAAIFHPFATMVSSITGVWIVGIFSSLHWNILNISYTASVTPGV